MGKRFFMSVAIAALALALGPVGCQSMIHGSVGTDDGDPSSLPWNAPASWEGKSIGIPY
jgi:hypothetical protein